MTEPTMSPADQILKDSVARKKRSMVDLTELNQLYGKGYKPPAPSARTPPTIYENLAINAPSSPSATDASSVPLTFIEKHHEFKKLVPSGTDGRFELFLKVADCFD